MKKTLIALTILLSSIHTFADVPAPRPIPRPPMPSPSPYPTPMPNDQLGMCLKNLHETQSQLQWCLNQRVDTREVDRLKSENEQLRNENFNLKNQLEEERRSRRPRTLGYFSYTSCKNYDGNSNLKFIASGVGFVPAEAETNSTIELSKKYTCNYGSQVVNTEEIKSEEPIAYCVAGCTNYAGVVDSQFIKASRGRNQTEASFLAIKSVNDSYNCNYGVAVSICQ